jgi:hypothetical protein
MSRSKKNRKQRRAEMFGGIAGDSVRRLSSSQFSSTFYLKNSWNSSWNAEDNVSAIEVGFAMLEHEGKNK